MTYCLAIRLDRGIVFAADTRTHAGVDYVTAYRKLHVFKPAADRVFVVLTAGSLATTQEVLQWVRRDLDAPERSENLARVRYPFEAAAYLGRTSRAVQESHRADLSRSGVTGEASFIVGGQIAGHAHAIFLVYPQGNFIEASADTPYLQIGESKYGKPMLDRLVTPALTLSEATKLALVSLDATIRSNITVGPPIDVAVYETDALEVGSEFRLEASSPYYAELRRRWQEGVCRAFGDLPDPPWDE